MLNISKDKKVKDNKNKDKKKTKVDKKVKKTKQIKDLTINDKKKKNEYKNNNNCFSIREVIVIIIITCLLTGVCTGGAMWIKHRKKNAMSYYGLDKDENLARFVEVYSDVLKNYYEDVDNEGMINTAIKYMLSYLGDDYTNYLSKEQAEILNEKLSGKYKGIGIQTVGPIIYRVYDDTPASEAGLKEGDVITKINDTEVTNDNYEEVTSIIKSGDSDVIHIEVNRDDEILSFEIERTMIENPVVSYEVIDNGKKKTGYIYISSFSNSLPKQLRKTLSKLEDEDIDNLIIDLRNNTGGYLEVATEVCEMFIEKGEVLYSLEGKYVNRTVKDTTKESLDYDIVILTNQMTASSSEILAAALKDSYGATIVGTKTYGKGKTQTTKNFKDGTMAKYTTSKWYRPNGDCIDKEGIEPDYEVELKFDEKEEKVIDTQLEKALDLLSK